MFRKLIGTVLLSATALAAAATTASAQTQTSSPFTGAKVNGGTVTAAVQNGKTVLTLSADFKVPDTPDPHWQIVDSKGNTYVLQRLGVKSLGGLAKDRINMTPTAVKVRLHRARQALSTLLRQEYQTQLAAV